MKKRNTILHTILSVFLIGGLLMGCEDKKDAYYERPTWLEPPIIEQLQKLGNMESFLALIQKSGYEATLSGSGYYTVFAPTDSAFHAFFNTNGQFTSVNDIDSVTAQKMVAYALLQNAYSKSQLDDYQSAKDEQWIINDSYKKQTNYYKWIYEGDMDGVPTRLLDANSVAGGELYSNSYVVDDYNYKSIPFFSSDYLGNNGLSTYDYEYFYGPGSFSGFNVVNAKMLQGDIYAENGIIHVVDKVIHPLPNIDDYLNEHENYSMFRDIIKKYTEAFVEAPDEVRLLFEQGTGSKEEVWMKLYPGLAFAPNCENYLRYGEEGEENDHQKGGWTLFAPTNEAVQQFFDEKFLKHYDSLDDMTVDQITDFLNAHFWLTSVWPSKFDQTQNTYGETARFDANANVVDKVICSNGIFYGVNTVQATDLYYTVLGDINLNPDYVLMLQAIRSFPTILSILKNPEVDLQMLLINNTQMQQLGFDYNVDLGRWEWTDAYDGSLGNNTTNALERLLFLHMIQGKNADFTTDGIVQTGIDDRGEYIKYYQKFNLSFIYGAGNSRHSVITGEVDSEPNNGQSYVLSAPLKFSIDNIGVQIEQYATTNYKSFYNYLKKSAESLNEFDPTQTMQGYLYNTETKVITDVRNTDNNTLLIPTNEAIAKAVADGVLPPITGADFTAAQQQKVANFVYYHILPKRIILPQNGLTDAAVTMYKNENGDTYVSLNATDSSMTVIDSQGNVANVVMDKSNVLANRAIIHQIDTYLRYPQN